MLQEFLPATLKSQKASCLAKEPNTKLMLFVVVSSFEHILSTTCEEGLELLCPRHRIFIPTKIKHAF